MTRTIVGKDGRAHIPARLTREAGLSPGDFVDVQDIKLRRRGHGRRAFLRWLIGGTALGFVSNLEDNIGFIERIAGLVEPDVDPEILQALFGPSPASSAAILPASDHPFAPPPSGETWYPIEKACSEAYQMRFAAVAALRRVSGYPRLNSQDCAIAFGSQISNLYVRSILGNPWLDQPMFHLGDSDWSTQLRWNLHCTQKATAVSRLQYGDAWLTKEHEIVSRENEVYRVHYEDGIATDDYLLITALPKAAAGDPQRSIIFGGIHGAGTLSAEKLLNSPPARLLKEIFQSVKGERYYQALLRIAVVTNDTNEARPGKVELVDARPLELSFRSVCRLK